MDENLINPETFQRYMKAVSPVTLCSHENIDQL